MGYKRGRTNQTCFLCIEKYAIFFFNVYFQREGEQVGQGQREKGETGSEVGFELITERPCRA